MIRYGNDDDENEDDDDADSDTDTNYDHSGRTTNISMPDRLWYDDELHMFMSHEFWQCWFINGDNDNDNDDDDDDDYDDDDDDDDDKEDECSWSPLLPLSDKL